MLRHIITSTAQMSTRSILVKPNMALSAMLSRRSVSMLHGSTANQRSKSIWPIFAGAGLATGFWMTLVWLCYKDRLKTLKECAKYYEFQFKNTDPKWKGRPKSGIVSVGLQNPWILDICQTTDLNLSANILIMLPQLSSESDFKEVSDFLKTRDILVEPTEAGVRQGLTHLAVEQMNKVVTKHFEKKCYKCPASESQQKTKLGHSRLQPLPKDNNMT